MEKKDQGHQIRYRAVVDSPLYVALQRDDATPAQGGELLDISLTGARLAVESTFRFDERFQLHLESKDGELSTKVACRVQWIRDGRSDSECTIGCTFESELDSGILDELVERAILERRESDREHVEICVSAKWDCIGKDQEAILHDISSGGFRTTAPSDVKVGSGISVQLDPEDGGLRLEGTVSWCSTSDNHTIVGCKWKNRQGTDWFRERTAAVDLAKTVDDAIEQTRWSGWLPKLTLSALLFIMGLQIGAYQSEIGQWLQSAYQTFVN